MPMQHRGGTAAAGTSANPVLAVRQIGVETDTGKIKVGDGVTAWGSLPYSGDYVTLLSLGGVPLSGAATITGVKTVVTPPGTNVLQIANVSYVQSLFAAADAVPIYVAAQVLNVLSGTWTTTTLGSGISPRTIADAVTGKIGITLEIPATWTSINLKAFWSQGDTVAGNVYFQGLINEYNVGDVYGAGTGGTAVAAATNLVANKLNVVDLGNFTVTGKKILQTVILVDRNQATDTYTGAVSVIGLEVTKVA